MSCIMNDGDQDPCILITALAKATAIPTGAVTLRVTNDKEVICVCQYGGLQGRYRLAA